MLLTLPFPEIDPVAIELGPLAIRWYALAYIVGLLLGWRYCRLLATRTPAKEMRPELFDDLLLWATVGVILGGRLGYMIFYQPGYYMENPLHVLMLWHGGMSFHGGLLGVAVAIVLLARRRGIPVLSVADVVACAAPIGLFLGRVANFINGELYGRTTDVPWAMVFPGGGPVARHPSQLYQAVLEGLLLVVLFVLQRRGGLRTPGLATGVFIAGYGAARFIGEFFREPDPFLGFLVFGATMGQLLSIPMILTGAALVVWSRRPRRFRRHEA